MKKFLLSWFLIVMTLPAWSQGNPVVNHSFAYDERVHDFGVIEEKKGPVDHTFTFTNNGVRPVVITEVSGWCGCTQAKFPTHAIRPGEKARVTVTFNPYGRPGKFSKEVQVILNGGKEFTRVWVKGTVKGYQHPVTEDYPYALGEGLYVGLKVIPFASKTSGARTVVTERIANNTNKPMTITFRRVPNNTVLKMPVTITLPPKGRTTFEVSYIAPREYSYDRCVWVYPVVNGKQVKPIKIRIIKKM